MPDANEIIFVSYRRTDAPATAARLTEKLTTVFGEGSIYLDVRSAEAGTMLSDELRLAVERSLLMICIIGDRWLLELSSRRSDGRPDFVVDELLLAKKLRIPILPVLVGDANMPAVSSLPNQMQFLALTSAVRISQDAQDDIREVERAAIRLLGFGHSRDATIPQRLRALIASAIRSPVEILFSPRRALLRTFRGRWSDWIKLVLSSAVIFLLTFLLCLAAFDVPLNSPAPFQVVALAAPAFIILTSLPIACVSALALRLFGNSGSFARMFAFTCALRLAFVAWIFNAFLLLLYVFRQLDPGVEVWTGMVWRANDLEQVLTFAFELKDYVATNTLLAMELAAGVLTISYAIWAHAALRALVATHGAGVGSRLLVLVIVLAPELGPSLMNRLL